MKKVWIDDITGYEFIFRGETGNFFEIEARKYDIDMPLLSVFDIYREASKKGGCNASNTLWLTIECKDPENIGNWFDENTTIITEIS